jgi:hypothetical protein
VQNFNVFLNGTNRIGFEWNAADGAAFYKVEYKKSTASSFLTLTYTSLSTNFIASDLESSTTYIFRYFILKNFLLTLERVYSGNTYYYESIGSTLTATTAAIPLVCNLNCGTNGTVIYAGNNCYCSCHNPQQCGSYYLDTTDCSCNLCLSKTGNSIIYCVT